MFLRKFAAYDACRLHQKRYPPSTIPCHRSVRARLHAYQIIHEKNVHGCGRYKFAGYVPKAFIDHGQTSRILHPHDSQLQIQTVCSKCNQIRLKKGFLLPSITLLTQRIFGPFSMVFYTHTQWWLRRNDWNDRVRDKCCPCVFVS